MLRICLSFDYELFLGKNNASYDKVLFEPTYKLLAMLKRNNVTSTFFVDVCSVWAHENAGLLKYKIDFEKQIKELLLGNQDVQLHLHTNWLKSDLKNGTISSEGYSIIEFGFDDSDPYSAKNIIEKSTGYLNDLCSLYVPEYRCIAYRAGGFCAQPEKELLNSLSKSGILIDSSVPPGTFSNTGTHKFDYRKVPHESGWWITNNFCENLDKKTGMLFEVPIATFKPNFFRILRLGKNNVKLPKHHINGEYVSSASDKKTFFKKIISFYNRLTSYRTLNFDSHNYRFVFEEINILERHLKRKNKDGVISLICHPKLLDECRIQNLENFINCIKNSNKNIEFVNFADLAKIILEEKKNG